jgi:predicted  nucleic acid-binding Zn-ribbon protein
LSNKAHHSLVAVIFKVILDSSLLEGRLDTLKATLKSLEEKEARYATAYGEGDHMMTLQVYQDNMHELNEKRAKLLSEISGLEDEMTNMPTLPLEKLVDGVINLVKDLDFTNKKEVIQKIVTKIVATKEEITIWGRIPVPVLQAEQVGLNAKYRHRRTTKRR